MILILPHPFPFSLSLSLIEREHFIGSSQFQLQFGLTKFDDDLNFGTTIWIDNKIWDNFILDISQTEFEGATIHDMSNDFTLKLVPNGIYVDVILECKRQRIDDPSIFCKLSSEKVQYDVLNVVCRAFQETERWWL